MARVLGVIAEYNPFHNGHLFHLKKAYEETESDYIVAVISGNFVQRGNVSCVNKWKKAEMALRCGVDLVIELPCVYSISSAENFAQGAIKLLNSLNIVKTVSFGTETSDFAALNNIANLLIEEPKEYINILHEELRKGVSFPKAREKAVLEILDDDIRYKNVLSGSNNILGIEYLKALKRQRSSMKPYMVKREKVFYHDDEVIDNFASATGIRKLIYNGEHEEVSRLMPSEAYNILIEEIRRQHLLLDLSQFEKIIIYNLRNMSLKEISNLPDVSEGLEYTIKNAANSCNNLAELINILKSKRYTRNQNSTNINLFIT